MKSLLLKFRISSALDDGQDLPPDLEKRVQKCDELQRFAQHARALEQVLRQAPTQSKTPTALHSSIMRAVKNSTAGLTPEPSSIFTLWRMAPGLAVAGLTLLAFWWSQSHYTRPAHSQSLAQASEVLQMGQQIVHTLPTAAMNPLASEMQHLSQDLRQTGEFLLANLP